MVEVLYTLIGIMKYYPHYGCGALCCFLYNEALSQWLRGSIQLLA